MNISTLHAILEQFELPGPYHIDKPIKGYRNSSYKVETGQGLVNLMMYKQGDSPADIRLMNLVTSQLKDSSLPVRTPLDQRLLRVYAGKRPVYAALYNYLPGETIPWEAYTRLRLREVGITLSDLHSALRNLEDTGARQAHTRQIDNIHMMQEYFSDPSVSEAAKKKLHLDPSKINLKPYALVFGSLGDSKAKQLLHMDFVRGNILFEESKITGILDFEKIAIGHPVIDVARTYSFLIIDGLYKTEAQVRKAFLLSGYIKRGTTPWLRISDHAGDKSFAILRLLTHFFLINDLYKFMKHNPYEHLDSNQHYLRTVKYLMSYELLSPVS